MKKYVYVIRDKKLQCYEPPVLRDDEPERWTEKTARGLRLISTEEKARARDMSLYYLGTFDDSEGKFDLLEHEEKLLDYEDYIEREVNA